MAPYSQGAEIDGRRAELYCTGDYGVDQKADISLDNDVKSYMCLFIMLKKKWHFHTHNEIEKEDNYRGKQIIKKGSYELSIVR